MAFYITKKDRKHIRSLIKRCQRDKFVIAYSRLMEAFTTHKMGDDTEFGSFLCYLADHPDLQGANLLNYIVATIIDARAEIIEEGEKAGGPQLPFHTWK